MGTIAIPFTEEAHSMILREARRKNMKAEVLLKVWVLERAKDEIEEVRSRGGGGEMGIRGEEAKIDTVDLVSLPLKFGYVLMASATATVSTLVNEFSK